MTKLILSRQRLQIGIFLTATAMSVQAGTFFSNFDTGALPAGSHTNANSAGGAFLDLTGGVGDSGCLKLTEAINGQNGSFILDDLDAGSPIYGFDVTFKVRIGGGTATPADGFSLSVGPDLTDTVLFGEGGTGSGLRFDWDIYNNPDTPPSPQINVRIGPNGDIVAWQGYTIGGITTSGDVTTWWTDVHIHLNPDGSLNLDYRGTNVFTNFFIPGYQDLVNAGLPVRFGLGARTGGLNANQWIDNLQITTYTQAMVGISQQPFSQTALQGDNATFDVRVANTNGVTYQWFSNSVAIAGATSQTLVISNVQSGASGSKYKVTAAGNNTVTSSEVTLTVTTLTIPSSPQLSFNFNDGLVPAGTAVFGTALVDTNGGLGNSGTLKLTTAVNGQNGAFVISDPNAGAPVFGFTARFKALVGGGTVPPADGFAFGFGNDIPADPTAGGPTFQEGAGLGTGLQVTFDIFNNDGILNYHPGDEPQPAPSIDVRFGGQVFGTVQLPVSFMETGLNQDGTPAYDDAIIQLNTDGTITVVYRGALVFNRLPIPAFGSISGGQFALGANTGGLNENMWFDNIELTSVLTSGPVRITSQTGSQTILLGHAMTNNVSVNDTNGVTYQWYRGSSAISGATTTSYVLPAVADADSGAVFRVTATKSSVTVTSTPATLTVADISPPTSPQFNFNFDDGLVPTGTAIYGNASVTASGGVGNSGVLHLTDAVNSQNSAFVVTNLVFNGAQVNGISVAFDLREGGGSSTPADGFSFNWAAGLTEGVVGGAETGTGNGFSLDFRIYIGAGNADNPPSPYIAIKYQGNVIASTQIPAVQLDTGSDFRTMLLRIDPNGKVYLAYGERVLYNGLQLPNYTFVADSMFGFYGRTGGLNENQWFDNIRIQATQSSGPLTVTAQPQNAAVISGHSATFTVGLSDPNGATYQWSKNGSTISGATTSSYTTPPTILADSGSTFKVTATGPSGTVTSSNAVLTVVAPITISSPIISYNFNDCLLPPGTILNGAGGGGYIDCSGGVGNSGVLKLTDTTPMGEGGTFIIPDANTNTPIKALTVYFAVLIGGGTVPPADGISFSFASSNEVPANVVASETGIGTGLIVVFDLYNGGNPYFGITYHGTPVVQTFVPYTAMETGTNFADTFIRVNVNGTVDVQFNGNVLFNQVVLPGYSAVAGFEYVFAGRTGGLQENQWLDNIQIATTTGLAPIPLDFSVSGGNLRLTWNGVGFKLQSSPSLSPATWSDVPGATSPYTAPLSGAHLFYRLAQAP